MAQKSPCPSPRLFAPAADLPLLPHQRLRARLHDCATLVLVRCLTPSAQMHHHLTRALPPCCGASPCRKARDEQSYGVPNNSPYTQFVVDRPIVPPPPSTPISLAAYTIPSYTSRAAKPPPPAGQAPAGILNGLMHKFPFPFMPVPRVLSADARASAVGTPPADCTHALHSSAASRTACCATASWDVCFAIIIPR